MCDDVAVGLRCGPYARRVWRAADLLVEAARATLTATPANAAHYPAALAAAAHADTAWHDAAAWYAATDDGVTELRHLCQYFTTRSGPDAAHETARYTTALRRGAVLKLVATETAARMNRPTTTPPICHTPTHAA